MFNLILIILCHNHQSTVFCFSLYSEIACLVNSVHKSEYKMLTTFFAFAVKHLGFCISIFQFKHFLCFVEFYNLLDISNSQW